MHNSTQASTAQNWSVLFHATLDAWRRGDAASRRVEFADYEEALVWARTQEMGRFPLATLLENDRILGVYLEPPADPLLMRQERVEIPALPVAPASGGH